MTDEELISSYYQGNGEALRMIFERHKEGVFHFALRMLNNRADAEDALSEAFMRLCSSQSHYKTTATFKTWLYTIVRHACIDRLRGKKKWQSLWFVNPETEEPQPMDLPDPKDTPFQTMQRKENAHYVNMAIARLPVDQREAIVLREYQQLTYDEIAQILGCSLANIKVLIYRARVQLKNEIPAFIKEGG